MFRFLLHILVEISRYALDTFIGYYPYGPMGEEPHSNYILPHFVLIILRLTIKL